MVYVVELDTVDEFYCFVDKEEADMIKKTSIIPGTRTRVKVNTLREFIDRECKKMFELSQYEKMVMYNKGEDQTIINSYYINNSSREIFRVTHPYIINTKTNSIEISGLNMCLAVYLENETKNLLIGMHYVTGNDEDERKKLETIMNMSNEHKWKQTDNIKLLIFKQNEKNKKFKKQQETSENFIKKFFNDNFKNLKIIETEELIKGLVIYPYPHNKLI